MAPTKKKKTKKMKFKIRTSSGDLVEIQLVAIFHKPPKGFKPSRELIESMFRHKAATARGQWNGVRVVGAYEGESPKGVELKIIQWRNPDRLADEDQGWRQGSQADAWGSLRRIIANAAL
jgi:hypothetical protein